MKREAKIKEEIYILRSNLNFLLTSDNNGNYDKNTILKASIALDKAILKYMKSVKY